MPQPTCTGPVSRRHFLRIGALTLAGLGPFGLQPWRLRAADTTDAADTSVILIWLPGGPPHMETYDMKPDAPEEYRGAFRPIKSVVPGLDVCELLPLHARVADKFSVVRSIAHNFADHGGGHKKFLTARDPLSPVGFVNDYPMVGSMVAEVLKNRRAPVPNYINGVDGGRQGIDTFSFGSAYLGPQSHPFTFYGDPTDPKFAVQNLCVRADVAPRLADRLAVLGALDRPLRGPDLAGTSGAIDTNRGRALELLTADTARNAFDLSREDARVRDRYGMHRYGQRALLARRLVEHGASWVTMVMENATPFGGQMVKNHTYNWDSHAVNCHIFNDAKVRFPLYDRAVTTLIEDIYARGLDKKVLLIATGEFGRTPRITYANGTQTGVKQPGRDHWPQAMSVLVSGGGLKVGQVVGSTNSKGEHPKDRPLIVNDLWATMFRHLNIDPRTSFLDHSGRPMPILQDGEPISELI
jgi:hypothetical protein